jgi:hypothetical protein
MSNYTSNNINAFFATQNGVQDAIKPATYETLAYIPNTSGLVLQTDGHGAIGWGGTQVNSGQIPVDVTNFNSLLSSAENTVQKALDKIDDYRPPIKYTSTLNLSAGAASNLCATTGEQNIALGNTSGDHITTGQINTLIGAQAGRSITTGSDNICIGTVSGCSATNNRGISIGRDASCTGDNTIAIGSGAVCTGNNAIAIGQSTSAAADSTVIGNTSTTQATIYGLKASGSVCDTTNFNNILSSADDTIQKALDTLDNQPIVFNKTGKNDIRIGLGASSAIWGISIGQSADVGGSADIAHISIGNSSKVTGGYGIAIGDLATAGENGIALGRDTTAGANAIAIGNGVTAATNTIKLGSAQNVEIGGYTKLGDGPAIKQKIITLPICNVSGSVSQCNHYITGSKIRRVSALVKDNRYNQYYLPSDTNSPGALYWLIIGSTGIDLYTGAAKDTYILNSTAYITIDYVE